MSAHKDDATDHTEYPGHGDGPRMPIKTAKKKAKNKRTSAKKTKRVPKWQSA